jgi:hypothetical protein
MVGAAVAFVLLTSHSFQECIDGPNQESGQQPLQKQVTLFKVQGPLQIYRNCLGLFIHDESDVIVALATVLLAVITYLLVRLGRDQSNTHRAELRAYVFPELATLFDGTMQNPPLSPNFNWPMVSMTFKNSGRSPAKQVVTWAEIDVIEPRHEGTLVVPPLKKIFAMSLGAGATFPKFVRYQRQLNAQEIADVTTGSKRIYLYGRAEYLDIFGTTQWTTFRVYYWGTFPNPIGIAFNNCEDGNDSS